MLRFTGTVQAFVDVEYETLAEWIAKVPLSDWPQQNRPGEPLQPAMVTDLAWHNFGARVQPIMDKMAPLFHDCRFSQLMLSVVMPGYDIAPHRDQQDPEWLVRVHVPLLTNERSTFICGKTLHRMRPGFAYKVNVLEIHSVTNKGETPRIHFMFDVLEKRKPT